ncbi:UDP-3-O-acyl-N-acetylglucosamine deacetylase [Methylobacterium sp. A54F]
MSPALPAPRAQATLAGSFALTGTGLHTGRRAEAVVGPARPGTGIVFRRTLPGGASVEVPAHWFLRVPRPLCTALQGRDGTLVRTVEHLLAALSALRIDNARVDLDAEELPILDGSATPWCVGIRGAGRTEQAEPVRTIRVLRPVEVCDGERRLRIEPAAALHLTGELSLSHFGPMRWSGAVTPESFERELAPSRSFGRLKWALPAKLYALVTREPFLRGANLRSTATIVGGRVIGGMRLPEEPVRHRMLDLVGDLALAGHPVAGRITAAHTGHELNHALVAALMRDTAAWELI